MSSLETTGAPQRSARRLIAVVTAALLGQFVATVAGLGTVGIAQPGHHLSETPGRDIVGGFVWIGLPGLAVLGGAEVALRFGHKVAASVVLGTGWLASMVACFEVWSDRGLECPSSDGGPTCPGRSFVAFGVVSAAVGLTLLAGALHWAGQHATETLRRRNS